MTEEYLRFKKVFDTHIIVTAMILCIEIAIMILHTNFFTCFITGFVLGLLIERLMSRNFILTNLKYNDLIVKILMQKREMLRLLEGGKKHGNNRRKN